MHYFIDFILESIGTYQSGISSMNTVYDITSRNFISGLSEKLLQSCRQAKSFLFTNAAILSLLGYTNMVTA